MLRTSTCLNKAGQGKSRVFVPSSKIACYSWRLCDALRQIVTLGFPRVTYPQDIDCQRPPAVALGTPQPISGVRSLDTLEEALEEIERHPVGCVLVVYPSLWQDNSYTPHLLQGLQVYEGPNTDYPVRAPYCDLPIESHAGRVPGMSSYHVVILLKILQIDGRLLGLVKMSNGVEVGYDGLVWVCLSTLYMLAYFSDQIVKDACMLTPRPTRLLTLFVVIDMFEREGFSDFSRLSVVPTRVLMRIVLICIC